MSVLRRRAGGRTFPAAVALAASVAFLIASLASPSLAEPAGSSGGAQAAVTQASTDLGLVPTPPRPSVTTVDVGTHDQAAIGLFVVSGVGVAVWLLPVRRHRHQGVVPVAGRRPGRSCRPRAPPVAPVV